MLFHFLPVPRGVQPTSCLNGTCWKVNVLPCWHTCSTCWVSCPVFCSSCFVSQRPEVRGCGKFRGRLNLFITLTGSVGGSVGDTPFFWRACFLASVCLTIRGQTIPSHNEWHSKNVPFFPPQLWLCVTKSECRALFSPPPWPTYQRHLICISPWAELVNWLKPELVLIRFCALELLANHNLINW